MLLRFMIIHTMQQAPFALAMGCNTLLPSIIMLPLPLPEEPIPTQERLYQEALFGQVLRLQELGG